MCCRVRGYLRLCLILPDIEKGFMNYFIRFLFIFLFCSFAGWLLEVAFRSIKGKRLINPGFLTGCCLPIYGFGGTAMFLLCSVDFSFVGNRVAEVILLLVLATVVMTLIEFIAGYISLRFYHNRLWDYSGQWGNIKGIICPLFSFFWGVICLAYYFLAYEPLGKLSLWVVSSPYAIFFLGIAFGIFLVDLCKSLELMGKLRKYAISIRQTVSLEKIKVYLQEENKKRKERKDAFMLRIHAQISKYIDLDKIKNIFKKENED